MLVSFVSLRGVFVSPAVVNRWRIVRSMPMRHGAAPLRLRFLISSPAWAVWPDLTSVRHA